MPASFAETRDLCGGGELSATAASSGGGGNKKKAAATRGEADAAPTANWSSPAGPRKTRWQIAPTSGGGHAGGQLPQVPNARSSQLPQVPSAGGLQHQVPRAGGLQHQDPGAGGLQHQWTGGDIDFQSCRGDDQGGVDLGFLSTMPYCSRVNPSATLEHTGNDNSYGNGMDNLPYS
jgi:hypothetical protein